jgi:hypothetical protein
VAINGESYILALPHGNTTFRLTSIKPYFTNIEVELTGKECGIWAAKKDSKAYIFEG